MLLCNQSLFSLFYWWNIINTNEKLHIDKITKIAISFENVSLETRDENFLIKINKLNL